ncbi:MAG: PilZ domain-containing protein [Deltaproteobacteria bacterium]|nr:PilZ domain-containing protein [Deltaproteobacteria bacterium]
MSLEKRLYIRRPWRSKIIFEDEFGGELLYLFSKDISLGGLFLEDPPPLAVGSLAFLSFALPDKKRPLRATGEVIRFAGSGIGIRFLDLEPEFLERLSQFIQRKSE